MLRPPDEKGCRRRPLFRPLAAHDRAREKPGVLHFTWWFGGSHWPPAPSPCARERRLPSAQRSQPGPQASPRRAVWGRGTVVLSSHRINSRNPSRARGMPDAGSSRARGAPRGRVGRSSFHGRTGAAEGVDEDTGFVSPTDVTRPCSVGLGPSGPGRLCARRPGAGLSSSAC